MRIFATVTIYVLMASCLESNQHKLSSSLNGMMPHAEATVENHDSIIYFPGTRRPWLIFQVRDTIRDGKYQEFTFEGWPFVTGYYKNDLRDSIWTYFFTAREVAKPLEVYTTTNYRNNVRVGIERVNRIDGSISEVRVYNPHGEIVFEANYKDSVHSPVMFGKIDGFVEADLKYSSSRMISMKFFIPLLPNLKTTLKIEISNEDFSLLESFNIDEEPFIWNYTLPQGKNYRIRSIAEVVDTLDEIIYTSTSEYYECTEE